MISKIYLRVAQHYLDHYFEKLPEMGTCLHAHHGQILAIDLEDWPLCIYAQVMDEKIQLLTHADQIDAHISGTSWLFLRMAYQSDTPSKSSLRDKKSNLQISGNVKLLLAVQQSLQAWRPDGEACLASIVGELPAHYLTHWLRPLLPPIGQMFNNLNQALAAYVRTEKHWLVDAEEMAWFSEQVNSFHDDLAHYEARLASNAATLLPRRGLYPIDTSQ